MNWNELLTSQIEYIYPVTDKLMAAVDDDQLDWKPATGENWMTGGQLLMHISSACGACFKGFVTGDWGALMAIDGEVSEYLRRENRNAKSKGEGSSEGE